MPPRRFVVFGGAGTIGRIVVRDLFESHPENHVVVADCNLKGAEKIAESFNSPRVSWGLIDARDPLDCMSSLCEGSVIVNCLQHNFNLHAMTAALLGSCHYVDLGGLFSWTRKQLRLNKKFQDAGLTAVIGMGCAPGITNVLAAYAETLLGEVRSLKIRVGSVDFNHRSDEFRFSYSIQTIAEELTLKPWIFSAGKFRQIRPRTGWELTKFPEPVGKTWTLWTRHSEVATLPLNLGHKGLRYCDFKVGFDREFVKKVMQGIRTGTLWHFKALDHDANPNDYEISRVIADDLVIDCHARPKPEWQAGAGDVDTGCPPSIVAQMIVDGTIATRGVMPPEVVVPIPLFFMELEKRGMEIRVSHK